MRSAQQWRLRTGRASSGKTPGAGLAAAAVCLESCRSRLLSPCVRSSVLPLNQSHLACGSGFLQPFAKHHAWRRGVCVQGHADSEFHPVLLTPEAVMHLGVLNLQSTMPHQAPITVCLIDEQGSHTHAVLAVQREQGCAGS